VSGDFKSKGAGKNGRVQGKMRLRLGDLDAGLNLLIAVRDIRTIADAI